MKTKDWNGHEVPLLAEAFSTHSQVEGVRVHVKATTEQEATAKVHEVIERQHGPFHRRTQGNYQIKFTNLTHN